MQTESKAKKNIDYSASAVNLCNPMEQKELLRKYRLALFDLTQTEKEAQSHIPEEIIEKINKLKMNIDTLHSGIQQGIDIFGSYQDVDNGFYAVKQRKTSLTYDPAPLKKNYPQFAPAVIVESVNVKAIEGLMKGGLLDKARLEADGVIKVSESFAYIVRV